MATILKNTTGSDIVIAGQVIGAYGQYAIQYVERHLFAADDSLFTKIGSSDVVVNDGVNDLGISDGIDLVKGYVPKEMGIIPETKLAKMPTFTSFKPVGQDFTIVSHDWCDKTTWFGDSISVSGETLTDSGDGLTFNSTHTHWIDLTHGKFYKEDTIASSYQVKVYDNGVLQTTGYTVNYSLGTVTFNASPTGPVTADYNYATTGTFYIKPSSGKSLHLEHAELQFSKDVFVDKAISFEVWAYNPYDLPNKVMVDVIKYKNEKDVINSSNLGQGYIPQFGNLPNDILVFPFNYAAVREMKSSQGVELRLSIGDTPLTGSYATVSFYCLSEDEA